MIFRPQGLIPVRQKLLTYGRELYVAARRRRHEDSRSADGGGEQVSRDSESPHDPGGVEAGAEVGEEYRSMSEDAFDARRRTDDHATSRSPSTSPTCIPELADPEVVAEIVAPSREIETEVGAPLVELDEVTVRFGGLDGAGRRDLHHQARRDPRPDRPERCRQDHLLQRDDRGLPANVRHGDVRRPGAGQAEAEPDHPPRHRPDVPEHPAVRRR